MFGLFGGDEKRFRASVDLKLNNEYRVVTDHDKNKNFPGLFKYIEAIDLVKKAGMNEDESAMHMATVYCCGLVKDGQIESANELKDSIIKISNFGLSKGIISKHWQDKHLDLLNREFSKYAPI
jgi:hypothetical protein